MRMTDSTADDRAECSSLLKVIADPTRMRIVEQLRSRPCTVSQLLEHIPIPQNLMSHHLKVLRDGGFVTKEREGKSIRYSLSQRLAESGDEAINLGCCTLNFPETDTE